MTKWKTVWHNPLQQSRAIKDTMMLSTCALTLTFISNAYSAGRANNHSLTTPAFSNPLVGEAYHPCRIKHFIAGYSNSLSYFSRKLFSRDFSFAMFRKSRNESLSKVSNNKVWTQLSLFLFLLLWDGFQSTLFSSGNLEGKQFFFQLFTSHKRNFRAPKSFNR